MTEQPDKLNQRLTKVQQELSRVTAAEHLFELNSGNLIVELLTLEITRLTRDITSNKYEKDHSGYVKALADLHAHRNLLNKLQGYKNPETRAKLEGAVKELDENGK